MQFPTLPCYLVSLRIKCLPQNPFIEHPQPIFLPQCERPSFTLIQKRRNCSILILYILYLFISFIYLYISYIFYISYILILYILIFIFLKSNLEDFAPNDNKDSLTLFSEKLAPTYQTKRNYNQKLTIPMKIHWPVNLKTFAEDLHFINLVIDVIFND